MYVVELDKASGGSKRLVRVHKGVAKVLAERHDGGYVADLWYDIHIDTAHGRIRVCIGTKLEPLNTNGGRIPKIFYYLGEEGGSLQQVFDIQDETFVSQRRETTKLNRYQGVIVFVF